MSHNHIIAIAPSFYPGVLEASRLPAQPASREPLESWAWAAPLPSKVIHESHFLKKIWSVVKIILQLILFISGLHFISFVSSMILNKVESWFVNPHSFELALYEDIVLSSSHRNLIGAKTSEVIHYLHDFFSRQKGIPQELLKELHTAAAWSEKMESAEAATTHVKKQKAVAALSHEITQAMTSLKEGEACLIPGGLSSLPGQTKHGLYRVIKASDGKFSLHISSRDPAFIREAEVKMAGKSKVVSLASFEGLEMQEIADPVFWQAILSLYLMNASDEKVTEGFKDRTPLSKLLAPFKDRYVPASLDSLELFHTQRQNPAHLMRVQNLWNLVHDGREASQTTIRRRKLQLSVETLFRYFEAVKDNMTDFPLHRSYLKEGLCILNQKIAFLSRKNWLKEEEIQLLQREFGVIESAIKAATPQEKNGAYDPILPWWRDSAGFVLPQNCLSPPASKDISPIVSLPRIDLEATKRSPGVFRNERPPTPFILESEKSYLCCSLEKVVFSPDRFWQQLSTLVEACQGMHPLDIQNHLLQVVLDFPYPYDMESQEIPQNFWQQIPADQRLASIQGLTELSETLTQTIKSSRKSLPNHWLSIIKNGVIATYLARLNDDEKNGHIFNPPQFSFFNKPPTFPRFIVELSFVGTPLASLTFRTRTQEEATIRDELENEIRGSSRYSLFQNNRPTNVYWEHFYNPETESLNEAFASRSPEIKFLKRHVDCLYEITGMRKDGRNVDKLGSFSSWGLPIENVALKAIAKFFKISTMSCEKSYGLSITQEGVMDDPSRVIRLTVRFFQKDVDRQPLDSLPLSSDKQKRLLLIKEEKLAFWNVLGAIKESPDLVQNAEVRAILELLFTNYERIKEALNNDPNLIDALPHFFKEQIALYEKKGDVESALFLVRLAHNLRFNWPLAGTQARIDESLNYASFLYDRLLKSFTPTSPYYSCRHLIVTEYLLHLLHKPKLSLQEIHNLILFGFLFESLPLNAPNFDPVVDDEVRRKLRLQRPNISQALQDAPSLLPAVLDQICRYTGVRIPDTNRWTGKFPEFRLNTLCINFDQGSCIDEAQEGNRIPIPPKLLRSTLFQTAFPSMCETQPKITLLSSENQTETYAFIDKAGRENRIEYSEKGIFFYKKEEERWLQRIFPQDFVVSEHCKAALPECILSQALYVDSFDPKHLFVYDSNQSALQFHIVLKPKLLHKKVLVVSKVTDLRPGGDQRQEMEISQLSHFDPVFLHPLLSFEEGKQIIVWSKNRKLKEIELPRHNLSFHLEDNGLVCASPPFKNYQIASNPKEYGIFGLPVFLLLISPEGHPKLVVPKCEGSFIDLFPFQMAKMLPKMNPFYRFIASWFIADTSKYPKYLWKSHANAYWTFDIEEDGKKWNFKSDKEVFSAWLDLFLYSLNYTQVETAAALDQGKWILSQIRAIPEEAYDQEALRSYIGKIQTLALEPNSVASAPYPETMALALQGLLLLKKQSKNKEREFLDEAITQIAIAYFARGKYADVNSLLSNQQLEEVLRSVEICDPNYFASHAAALLTKEGENQVTVSATRSHFFTFIPPRNSICINGLAKKILRTPVKEQLPIDAVLFTKKPDKLLKAFRPIYNALQSPSTSLDFRQMRLTLQTLPLHDTFTAFVEMLFEAKADNPSLSFPPYPALEYPENADFLYGEKRERALESRTKSEATLQSLLEQAKALAKISPLAPQQIHEELLPNEAPPHSLIKSVSIETLEHDLRLRQADKTPKINRVQGDAALFSLDEVQNWFTELSPPKPLAFSLNRLQNHEESSVRKLGEKLQRQIQAYEKELQSGAIKKFQIKDLVAIRLNLDQKISDLRAQSKKAKADIFKILSTAQDARYNFFEQRGALMPRILWHELQIAFLQGDLSMITAKLPGVRDEELHESLMIYFTQETLLKHALFIQTEVNTIEQENLVNSPAFGEKLYQLLTRCRGYDPKECPSLLLIEDSLGFLMRQEQLHMVQDVIDNPRIIGRAITGSGKTKVIMLLLGLLKANGTNLVTLKFLDPLLPENLRDLQKQLGGIMQKRVMTLLFSSKTPLVKNKTSIFKEMYEELLMTILEKGCVVTNRRSQPLLEAKFIALLHKLSDRTQNHQEIDPIELEHLQYLGKILYLFKQRQACIYDEHDKSLYPRDQIHLAIGETDRIPQFAIDTVKNTFDHLIRFLDLKLNIQADLTPEERLTILTHTADSLASEWSEHLKVDKGVLFDYFTGRSEELLQGASQLSKEHQDQLALTKDLILTYLPLTLSHTAHKKYILSKEDHINVIPCEYADVPKEGSLFDNLIERLTYTVQYYHQKGVSRRYLKEWIEDLRNLAFKEMQEKNLTSFHETAANKLFEARFKRSLPLILQEADIENMHQDVQCDPKLISFFLDLILQEMRIQRKKISMDSQNLVSMSKDSAGISATEGCLLGLHSQFILPSEDGDHTTAQMISRFIHREKVQDSPLKFSPENPGSIISELRSQDPSVKICIDGAGALWGVSPQKAAEQLLQSQPDLTSVAYFNEHGTPCVEGVISKHLSEKGQFFPHAQARGADVVLSPSQTSVLTVNGRTSLEEVSQNEGRLRNPEQPLRLAVPKISSIKSVEDLICASVAVQGSETSDNVYRSETQKLRDTVRCEMLDTLISLIVKGNTGDAFSLILKYTQESSILISEKIEDLRTPGNYFKAHQYIQKKDLLPVKSLEALKTEYLRLCDALHLYQAQAKLNAYNPQALSVHMPPFIWNTQSLITDQEALVEIDVDIQEQAEIENQKETDVQTEVVAAEESETSNFLDWLSHSDTHFKWHYFAQTLHRAFNTTILFTENYLPLHRKDWALLIHHRQPHDLRQNRLHYIYLWRCKDPQSGALRPMYTIALDLKDTAYLADTRPTKYKSALPSTYETDTFQLIYDTKLHRFIGSPLHDDPLLLSQFYSDVAQMRFEDGQYDKLTYSEKEWEALRIWLSNNKKLIGSLEDYFLKEVLKNRPKDQQLYPHSDLYKLFREI